MAGYRNMALFKGYLLWCLIVLWMLRPTEGNWTADLVNAAAAFCGATGVSLIGVVFGRGYNKKAETPTPEAP